MQLEDDGLGPPDSRIMPKSQADQRLIVDEFYRHALSGRVGRSSRGDATDSVPFRLWFASPVLGRLGLFGMVPEGIHAPTSVSRAASDGHRGNATLRHLPRHQPRPASIVLRRRPSMTESPDATEHGCFR